MSVVIVVKVSEGLVLAADSAATISGSIETPNGRAEGVLKVFYNARKLLHIGDFPIGALTWGIASIGPRTIESLIREWEYENRWQRMDTFEAEHTNQPFEVSECAKDLRVHLSNIHHQQFGDLPSDQQPPIGVVVAGYSKGEFFPEIWRFVVPIDNEIHNQRPDKDGKPDFGASWFGLTDAIVRLHFGRDERLPEIIAARFGVPKEQVVEALAPLQYQVPFAQMPLQDAIDYANYILTVATGRFRFVVGAELCGGEIEIAAITQSEFNWISRKSWKSQ